MTPDASLLALLPPDVRVLVWTGEGPLSEGTPGFDTVDYLLDGLARGHLRQSGEDRREVVFVHNLDGETFWAAYIDASTLKPGQALPQLTDLLPAKAREKVLVLEAVPLTGSWAKALDEAFGYVEKRSL